jgi:hypothetical protein
MYDPMMPNDYLEYKQRNDNESMQAHLQKQSQKTMAIESEGQKALASGNLDQIVESRSASLSRKGDGRGRGRGMSNLPACLVNKQEEDHSKTES